WMVFVLRRDIGLLPAILSVWVRPDNLVVCLIIVAALCRQRRLRKTHAAALALLVVASVALISHYGNGTHALYAHSCLGSEPGADARFGISDYVHALTNGLKDILHGPLIGFFLLWSASFVHAPKAMRQILAIVAFSSALRFVIFPSYEERFFALFF